MPTYFATGDLRKGIDVSALFARHGLYALAKCRVLTATKAFPTFPNAITGKECNWGEAGEGQALRDGGQTLLQLSSDKKRLVWEAAPPSSIALSCLESNEFQLVLFHRLMKEFTDAWLQPIVISNTNLTWALTPSTTIGVGEQLSKQLQLLLPYRSNEAVIIRLETEWANKLSDIVQLTPIYTNQQEERTRSRKNSKKSTTA
jgi:hypothetical protein